MTKGFIVLMPQDFRAEDYEEQIRKIIENIYEDLDFFDVHQNKIFTIINKFSTGGIYTASNSDEDLDDIPYKMMEVILDLCTEIGCVVTTLDLMDGEDFILNLRENEDKLSELL